MGLCVCIISEYNFFDGGMRGGARSCVALAKEEEEVSKHTCVGWGARFVDLSFPRFQRQVPGGLCL